MNGILLSILRVYVVLLLVQPTTGLWRLPSGCSYGIERLTARALLDSAVIRRKFRFPNTWQVRQDWKLDW